MGKQLSAGLHCESGITRLWGWGVFELLEVCGTGGTQETVLEQPRKPWQEQTVNTDHITQVLSKITFWKVRRGERFMISASLLSRTVEA